MVAVIDDPGVVERVLRHLGLPTKIPVARPARAPPVPLLAGAPPTGGAPNKFFVDDPA